MFKRSRHAMGEMNGIRVKYKNGQQTENMTKKCILSKKAEAKERKNHR